MTLRACILHLLRAYSVTLSQSGQLSVGLLAQLVEHYTGMAEVMARIPFKLEYFFFQALISRLLTLCA